MAPSFWHSQRGSLELHAAAWPSGPEAFAFWPLQLPDFTGKMPVPQEKPYGERSAAVEDAFGNMWYLACYKGGPEKLVLERRLAHQLILSVCVQRS